MGLVEVVQGHNGMALVRAVFAQGPFVSNNRQEWARKEGKMRALLGGDLVWSIL